MRGELDAYGEGLGDKPEILCLNKIDALDPETRAAKAAELAEAAGHAPMMVSGVSGEGVNEVLRAALVQIHAARQAERALTAPEDEGWKP